MKKLLYLFMLMFISNVNGQNIEYLKNLKSFSKYQAKNVVLDIMALMRKEYEIVHINENEFFLSFVIVEKTLDSKTKKKIKSKYDLIDKAFEINFFKINNKINDALEIKAEQKYEFREIELNYLDIFPYWSKYFNKDSKLEETITDKEMQEVHINEENINAYFIFENSYSNKIWKIFCVNNN